MSFRNSLVPTGSLRSRKQGDSACGGHDGENAAAVVEDFRRRTGGRMMDLMTTDGYPAYYMINCAHPTHFADTLAGGGAWVARRPQASW